ncbi:hypothetical protein [Lentilactobacillus hilgardii]|jgi:hypothetical protein|nr:hypothetical protein [Lentilactobacillus hilgardii]EEI71790.1 hypothetical protein HMPREF0496_0980 [Lentilactobacillus hilgardii ATCC 27305]
MKAKGFVAGVAAVFFIGMGESSNSQSSSTASWHKGTPGVVRNKN